MQVAARSGGIFFPLAKALCLACGSDPANGSQSKMGASSCAQVVISGASVGHRLRKSQQQRWTA